MITGGTGNIGTELVRRLLETEVEEIRIYSRTEWRQFELREKMGNDPRIRLCIGDVRDYFRLFLAVRGVDAIYHLASMRHIDFCDHNVSEADSNIVQGTRNVADISLLTGVRLALFTSTAEAVNPTNVYGCAKHNAERIFWRAHEEHGENIRFVTTRFGNVLGGHGSVIPKLAIRMKNGEPVQLYGKKMRRRIMTIPQAAAQILAATEAPGGSVVIPSLPLATLKDIAYITAEILKVKPDIEITEPRAGEKLVNLMLGENERRYLRQFGDYFLIDRANPPDHPAKWDDCGIMEVVKLRKMLKEVLDGCQLT